MVGFISRKVGFGGGKDGFGGGGGGNGGDCVSCGGSNYCFDHSLMKFCHIHLAVRYICQIMLVFACSLNAGGN